MPSKPSTPRKSDSRFVFGYNISISYSTEQIGNDNNEISAYTNKITKAEPNPSQKEEVNQMALTIPAQ